MRFTFVSNYINHHQQPFCAELARRLEPGDFAFIQTEPMERGRVDMGWGLTPDLPEYVHLAYASEEENARCRKLIYESDVVLFGGCEEESYIRPRLDAGRLTLRYSERVYKEGQWKWITPRGLRRKYLDHTRYRNAPVYLLCAGGYVASDFGIFGAYPEKMLRWGYFPALRGDPARRSISEKDPVRILWAGRFLDWKHPELPIWTAKYLKEEKIPFAMEIIGGGAEEKKIKALRRSLKLEREVMLPGYRTPDQVRDRMRKADIYLFTSDRKEGWGAVLNEAMNAGCAVVADSMIGAVPFLLQNGENGIVYPDGDSKALFQGVRELAADPLLRLRLGHAAYETISGVWNPAEAAERILDLIGLLQNAWGITEGAEGTPSRKPEPDLLKRLSEEGKLPQDGPCSILRPRSEKRISKEASQDPKKDTDAV
ncbi:MAG: glycosyltransferase family 4 protein [Lachnospiraceae bacterium]|nr:glycosyltransferase family 4 protein [Lachnospiraceae bacterium]